MSFTRATERLRGLGFDMVASIKNDLRRERKIATGNLLQSTRFQVTALPSNINMSFFADKYWEYVDKGRRPGKFPPVRKILQWVKRKPIRASGISDKQMAFLVGRKIAREGIEGTNIYTNNIDKFKKKLALESVFLQDVLAEARKSMTQ